MLHRIHALIAACVVLLAGVLVSAVGVPDAAADDECDLVFRPPAGFVVAEPNDLEFSIDVDLEQNTVQTIESTRVLARFRLDAEGFGEDSTAAVMAYLDSLVDWYRYLDAPCADPLPYDGPYTNRPASVDAPYGFGGVDVAAGPPVVITVTRPEGGASVEVGRVVTNDGPDLAHSGSESYVLAYFGAGLLAFGASALGMRRWMSGPIDEPTP